MTDKTTVIVTGTLIKARWEEKSFRGHKGEKKFYLSLADVEELPIDVIEAFKDAGEKFTPTFVKDFDGYVNVSSKFDIPMIDVSGGKFPSLQEEVSNGYGVVGAKVRLSLDCKEGAVYPRAIRFLTEGTEFDPFEGL